MTCVTTANQPLALPRSTSSKAVRSDVRGGACRGSSRDAASFSVRRAVLSLAPDWIPASTCPTRGLNLPTSAPLRAVSVPDNGELQWHGELIMSRIALRDVARQRCEAHALLQFARIPWLSESAQVVRLGDLRYDREPAPGFAEIDIE